MRNEIEIKKFIEYYEEFEELVRTISSKIAKIRGEDSFSADEISLEEGNVSVSWTETWNFGGYEDHVLSFPIYYLWNKNYIVIEQKQKIKQIQAIKDKETKQEKLEDSNNRKLYKKLKKKYG